MLPLKGLIAAAAALIMGVVAGACWRAFMVLPMAESPINDARVPAARLLSDAPGARSVAVLAYANDPKQRIIQVDDAHYITLNDFTREARETSLRCHIKVTDEEIHRFYCDYVDNLLDLRDDQLMFLRWLVDRYGLKSGFFEGLCDDDVAAFVDGAARFKAREPTLAQLADAMRQSPHLTRKSTGNVSTIDNEVAVETLLWHGTYYASLGRLVLERPQVQVLAPEERMAFDEAYLETKASKNDEKAKLREAVIVTRLLAHKGCSVIILGAGHDLSHEIRKQSQGGCDYVKVTPARFPAPPLKAVGGSWPLNGAGSTWASGQQGTP